MAALLGVGRSSVYERIQAGTFPIRVLPGLGRSKRFAKADVERYLTGKGKASTETPDR